MQSDGVLFSPLFSSRWCGAFFVAVITSDRGAMRLPACQTALITSVCVQHPGSIFQDDPKLHKKLVLMVTLSPKYKVLWTHPAVDPSTTVLKVWRVMRQNVR